MPEPARTSARWGRILLVLLAAVLVPSVPFVILGELPGERWLSAQDANAAGFGALGALLLALDLVLPIPSSIIGVMLGGRLGWAWGFASAWAGLFAGHCAGYWLGRLAPERWAGHAPLTPSKLGVLTTRPVPVLAEAVALAAGATRLPWSSFAAAALVGDAIYAAVLSATGAALLPEGWYVTALILPMTLAALAWWLGARRTR